MNSSKINLDCNKLLGFRLITSHNDNNANHADHFSKVGRKNSPETLNVRIGGKAGAKVGSKSMINARLGVKAGVKLLQGDKYT